MITVKDNENKKDFYFKKVYLGYAYIEVDGFYVFVFAKGEGFWSDYSLRWIADKLTELNREWNTYINQNLNK